MAPTSNDNETNATDGKLLNGLVFASAIALPILGILSICLVLWLWRDKLFGCCRRTKTVGRKGKHADPEQGISIELVDNTTRVNPNPNIVTVGGNSIAARESGINIGHPRADPFADPTTLSAKMPRLQSQPAPRSPPDDR